MSNQEIAITLKNAAAAYSMKDDKKFRFQILAYQKASDTIANLNSEIIDYYKSGTLDSLPGIGPTIKSHIEELIETGKSKHFEWVFEDIPEAVFPLLAIPSFGPKKSYILVKHFNLKSKSSVIDELEKLAEKGKIASLPGFGEKSQSDILRAISEFRKGTGKTTRMVLPYAFEIAEKLISYLKESKYVVDAQPLGSLRRKMPTVGDIDVAVASKNPKEVIEHFVKYPYIERVIEKGDVSSSILASGGKQVDLMIQPVEAFGSLLQHFTGSKAHNVHLREFALKKKLSLSEYGIKDLSKKENILQKFDNEEDFYKAVGLAWIPPEIRENTGEIELAEKNQLPKLIETSDLKGDLHLHSDFPIEPSHDLGRSTIKEMRDKAISLKYEYMAFSEHNPSTSKHTKSQIYNLIRKRNEKIEQLKSDNKSIRVFKMLEVDILPNGSLAIDDKSLDLLDAVIVSIHSVFSMEKTTMTKRILEGLSNSKAKILAHPTGRLLNTRAGYEIDFEKIFEFCKKHNKALEINSWPSRLDLTDTVIRMAVESNVKMVIDSDSHQKDQMELQKFGVAMARRGWATKDDILNTLSYNKFSEWIFSH